MVNCPSCGHQFNPSRGNARPKKGTITGNVWDLCDELEVELGRQPKRTEILEAGQRRGININTVMTQAQKWLSAKKAQATAEVAAK